MLQPRLRALLSLGLIGCMTLSLMPLGCYPVKLRHSPAPYGSPRIPEATAARLEECVKELEDEINHGHYSVDAKVEVDEDGRVVAVEMEGAPNPGVGTCMRMALRGMRLPEHLLETGMLRTSSAANGQAMPDRGQIGEVVIITVVTIVFTEVIIETFAIAIGVTVTATVAAGAAEAIRKRKDPGLAKCRQKLNRCLESNKGGEPGNNYNTTLCPTCFDLCRASEDKQWPRQIGTGQSCIYPGYED